MGDKMFTVKTCSLIGILTTALMAILVYNVNDVLRRLERLECNTQRILVKIGLEPVSIEVKHKPGLPGKDGQTRGKNPVADEPIESRCVQRPLNYWEKTTRKNLQAGGLAVLSDLL